MTGLAGTPLPLQGWPIAYAPFDLCPVCGAYWECGHQALTWGDTQDAIDSAPVEIIDSQTPGHFSRDAIIRMNPDALEVIKETARLFMEYNKPVIFPMITSDSDYLT